MPREPAELIRAEGGEALFVETDVADPADMMRQVARASAADAGVDILVNTATLVTVKPLLDHSLDEWERVVAVNLRGAFLGIKMFL